MSETAKQRHRAGVFEEARGDDGLVRCAVRSDECRGRLQAAHYISCQQLRIQQSQQRIRYATTRPIRPPYPPPIVEAELDELYADPRNGLVLCEHHHSRFDGHGTRPLTIPPPPRVIEFCEHYGLTHLLDLTNATERSTAA